MQKANTLYEDKYLRISEDSITLFWYYFPFAQSKVIEFSEIKQIKLEQLDWKYGKYRLWGMDLRCHWFPCDMTRYKKSNFIWLDVSSRIKPSFTCENVEQVYSILSEKKL